MTVMLTHCNFVSKKNTQNFLVCVPEGIVMMIFLMECEYKKIDEQLTEI